MKLHRLSRLNVLLYQPWLLQPSLRILIALIPDSDKFLFVSRRTNLHFLEHTLSNIFPFFFLFSVKHPFSFWKAFQKTRRSRGKNIINDASCIDFRARNNGAKPDFEKRAHPTAFWIDCFKCFRLGQNDTCQVHARHVEKK